MNPFLIALAVGIALGAAAVTVLILLSILFTYTRLGWKTVPADDIHGTYLDAFKLAMARYNLTSENIQPSDYDNIAQYMRTYFHIYQVKLNVDRDTVDLLAVESRLPKPTLRKALEDFYGGGQS